MIAAPLRTLPLLATALLLCGCAHSGGSLGYYWQKLRGHLALLQAAEPVQQWLDKPDTPAPLRARLALVQQARAFAVTDLALPDNASYHRFARLERRAAVWNVVAAGPYSLVQLHRWCFPVTGCIGYRGYFDEADARTEAAQLAATGLEVNVYGVPAYSTLGYSNWLGGDPLLSTFIAWPEGDFVRLLLHELAQLKQVYAAGDTAETMSPTPRPWSAWAWPAGCSSIPLPRRARPICRQRGAARAVPHPDPGHARTAGPDLCIKQR